MAETAQSLLQLCRTHTRLEEDEIRFLEDLADQLPFVAELTNNDIFIDALTGNRVDAIVLAWARPNSRSLYGHSVVGEIAYATREPAVYQCFSSGEMVRNVRGVSQEGVPIDQTVVPLRGASGRVVGVLIMERDITDEIRQEERVEFLSETAERLSSTLMSLSMTGFTWEEWLGNGIFVLDKKGTITYANKNAARLYRQYYGKEALSGDLMSDLLFDSLSNLLADLSNPRQYDFGDKSYLFQAHPLVAYGEVSGCVISLQDVTELRRKERQLSAQTAIIREIHHRVKNNLQNVVALLRLQMSRSESELVQAEFHACINRILSIARVHDVFASQRWDSLDLLELADYVLTRLIEAYVLPDQHIKKSVHGKSVRLPASQAVPMSLVLNELITNSLKHGIKTAPVGEISILVEQSDNTVHIIVSDSGQGFDSVDLNNLDGHFGLYVVNLLICEQLEGKLSIEHGGESTVAKVSFQMAFAEETG